MSPGAASETDADTTRRKLLEFARRADAVAADADTKLQGTLREVKARIKDGFQPVDFDLFEMLTSHAALSGDPEAIVHAVAMDPLSAAVCTLKEIRDMCREMLEAERAWLPQFEGKEIRPTPTIFIPSDRRPAEVPLDPALAINKRFATMIEQKTD